ncbi:MAG: membrane protein insertase YidC [Bacteroidales bacterium]|nr:membrane protein insertase YidC [Bacteroidales bacterium]MBN2758054.1 membrane protein insertase YidC [Bacteroidales bacterium]
MDKNQTFGIILIVVILIIYSIYTKPSEKEIEAARQERLKNDSIRNINEEIEKQKAADYSNELNQVTNKTTIEELNDSIETDTAKISKIKERFGSFGESAFGEEKFIVIENELIRLKVYNKGGRPYSVELKNYLRHDSLPLLLFDGDETVFGLNFFAENRRISTNNLFFEPEISDSIIDASTGERSLKMRLKAGDNKYIEYVYTLKPNSYMVDFNIHFVGMDNLIASDVNYIDMTWHTNVLGLEKGRDWEDQNTGIYWKYYQDEVDYLSETSDHDEKTLTTRVKWVAFKHQFFSSVLISKSFMLNAKLEQQKATDSEEYLKRFDANISLPFEGKNDETLEFSFYYGPNKYKTLKNLHVADDDDLNLQKMIPLGWGIFGWINRFAIIPLFNFLGGFMSNYGIIILVMTLLIKLVLFPLTYKSFASSAKMRVLKPQIDEINEKIPKEKAMERQQATMALYRKAGVNPMGGCIPMALQMPILIAMYRFFPASIELRQQSFLWAQDLSSYDSILQLPFTIWQYGDHVSLFTVLMAISMVFSTKLNSSQMQGSSSQMPGMKTMMYMMPVMMLFWFNNYSAGLSYYYFLSNVITIGQTIVIRNFVDDEAVLAKLNANKKKPKKKSRFQSKLEDIAKQQKAIQGKKK